MTAILARRVRHEPDIFLTFVSGHFLSKHYDDFLDDWRAVRHKKMRMERWDIEKGAVGHLRLTL